MPVEYSDPAQEPPDYKKQYVPLGRTASWARREADSIMQEIEDLRRRANEEGNDAETLESDTIVTTNVRQRRQQPGAPAAAPTVTVATRTRRKPPEESDSPPIVVSARAVRQQPAQAPATRQTRGSKKVKKESPKDRQPTQNFGGRRIKVEQTSPHDDDDLGEASPPWNRQALRPPQESDTYPPTDREVHQHLQDIMGDRRTESEMEFDRRYPNRLVRRLRTWGGPLYTVGLSLADRANMSSIPGPRKRIRVQ